MGQNARRGMTMADDLLTRFGTSRSGHSHFAPSAAERWLTCPGSLLANVSLGDSAYGTVAHRVAEAWNQTGKRPDYMVGLELVAHAGGRDHRILVDDAMVGHVERFVDWCAELPGQHYTEQHVDLSELMPIPNQGGTADHFACEPGKLTITDLKMGTGVRVYAEHNPQAMLYASGVFLEWDWIYGFQTIVIRICQPRLDVFETWECSRQELLDFMEHVKQRAQLAWQVEAPRSPSPKACRFCGVAPTCPARAMELADFVDAALGDECEPEAPKEYPYEALENAPDALEHVDSSLARLTAKELPAFSTRQLAFLLSRRRHIELWFKAVASYLLDLAERGETIPFFKLTDGRMKREWKDEDVALNFIEQVFNVPRDEVMPPTMLTVNKAEKLLHALTKQPERKIKQTLREVVAEHAGKRTLALDRSALPSVDDALDEFDAEDEAETG
jgi:hypothetical protein